MQMSYHLKHNANQLPSSLGATGFMKGLSAEIRQGLIKKGRKLQFGKGQIIQQRGDEGSEFWYIESGSVQIGRFSEDGELTLFTMIEAGESFGEQAFLGEFPRMVDAIAATECTVIRIGEAELQHLLETQPRAARILLKTMAHALQEAFDLVEAGRRLSTVQRLAQALVRQCGNAPHATINMTQQELADLIGVSRVSLGKALAELDIQGLVHRGYGKLSIPDSGLLAKITEI